MLSRLEGPRFGQGRLRGCRDGVAVFPQAFFKTQDDVVSEQGIMLPFDRVGLSAKSGQRTLDEARDRFDMICQRTVRDL